MGSATLQFQSAHDKVVCAIDPGPRSGSAIGLICSPGSRPRPLWSVRWHDDGTHQRRKMSALALTRPSRPVVSERFPTSAMGMKRESLVISEVHRMIGLHRGELVTAVEDQYNDRRFNLLKLSRDAGIWEGLLMALTEHRPERVMLSTWLGPVSGLSTKHGQEVIEAGLSAAFRGVRDKAVGLKHLVRWDLNLTGWDGWEPTAHEIDALAIGLFVAGCRLQKDEVSA